MFDFSVFAVIYSYLVQNFLPILGGFIGSVVVALIRKRFEAPSDRLLKAGRRRLLQTMLPRSRGFLLLRKQQRVETELATIILVAQCLQVNNLDGQVALLPTLAIDARAAAFAASLLLTDGAELGRQAEAQAKALSVAAKLHAAMKRQIGLAATRHSPTLTELVFLLDEVLK